MARLLPVLPAALLLALGLSAQEGPSLFQIWLPDFSEAPFAGTDDLIQIPDRPIRRMRILIRGAQERNMNPGRYRVVVNGKGLANAFEERTVPDGTLLVMEPDMLRKRPDEVFDIHENAVELMAEDRRGRKYYHNWIIRVDDAGTNPLFNYASSLALGSPQALPPDLLVTEPVKPILLAAGQSSVKVALRGTMSAPATLKVNNRPVFESPPGPVAEFSLETTVSRGQSELVLEAVDAHGDARKVVIPVHAIEKTRRPVPLAGHRYALAIGISDFGRLKGTPPRLPAAAAAAQQFAAHLIAHAGFKKDDVRTITDDQATLEQVRIALSDFTGRAQSADTLVIYIATLGFHDPRVNRGDHMYLAVNGTQFAALESTALALNDIEILLNRSVRTNQLFLIWDVGHPLPEDWRFRGGRSLVNNYLLNLFGDKPDWSVLVSGSTDEVSALAPAGGDAANAFNSSLEKALAGEADGNGDGVVTAGELFAFVSARVRAESQGRQNPRFRIASSEAGQAFTVR